MSATGTEVFVKGVSSIGEISSIGIGDSAILGTWFEYKGPYPLD